MTRQFGTCQDTLHRMQSARAQYEKRGKIVALPPRKITEPARDNDKSADIVPFIGPQPAKRRA